MYELPTNRIHATASASPKPSGLSGQVDSSTPRASVADFSFPVISVAMVLGWLRRGIILIILCAILGAVGAVGYAVTAKKRFTVSTGIFVPPASLQLLPNELSLPNQQSDAQILEISSKLLLLKSGNVLRRVVNSVGLQSVAEFNGEEKGLLPNPAQLLGMAPPVKPGDKTLTAMQVLEKRITAAREPGTYLVTISLWTRDPDLSVRVADALAAAFQSELTESQVDIARNATTVIGSRLDELRAAVTQAENAAATFRQTHNLQKTAGDLVSAQSLAQLNVKLNDATAKLADASARYKRLGSRSPPGIDAATTLDSPLLTSLREQYSLLKQKRDQLAMTYGGRYPQLIATNQQLATLEEQIRSETARTLATIKIEVDQAQASVNDLTAQLQAARGQASSDDSAQVQLAELERDMRAKALLYETFLKRAGETGQQEQLNISNVRVVTQAFAPEKRSWPPPTSLLAAAGLVGGGMVGVGLALAFGLLGVLRGQYRARSA